MARTADYFSDFVFSTAENKQPIAPADDGNAWRDIGASLVAGEAQLVGGIGNLIGAEGVVKFAKDAELRANAKKSKGLISKEAALSESIQRGEWWEAAKAVASDLNLFSSMTASSAPSMVLGMGLGGLAAKGILATKGLGVAARLSTSEGALTAVGSRLSGGIGEGLAIVPDVYQNTEGDKSATVAGFLLGVGTNLVTPGNISASAVKRMTGEATEGAVVFGGTGVRNAIGRAGVSAAAEGAQEFLQEGGQALIEQNGRGEDLNFRQAAAQGAVGAVLGGGMGAGLHPVVGDGSHAAAKEEELDIARKVLGEVETAGGDTSVLQATVNKLELEAAILRSGAAPTAEQQSELRLLDAKLVAARNPGSKEAADNADTAEAVHLANLNPNDVARGTELAVGAARDAIQSAETLDDALGNFAAAEQASSVGRVGVAAARNVVDGVVQAATAEEIKPAAPSLYTAEGLAAAEADVAADPGTEREQIKTERERLKLTVAQAAVRERYNGLVDKQFAIASNPNTDPAARSLAIGRIAAIEAERDRIAPLPDGQVQPSRAVELAQMPSQTAPVVDEAPIGVDPIAQMRGPYTVVRSPEGWDVLSGDDSVYDTYPLSAPEDAARAAEYLNRQEGTRVEAAERMTGADRIAAFTSLIREQRQIAEDRGRPIEERDAATAEARRLSTLRDSQPAPTTTQRAREADQLLADLQAPSDVPPLRPRLRYVQDDQNNWNILDERSGDYVFREGYATRAELADVIRTDTMLVRQDATPAAPRRGETVAAPETRNVETNFPERGMAALTEKTLEKLGRFWSTVMAGRGQRVLYVNTRSLAGRGLSQAQLTKLKDKYNTELRKQAAIWAEANNETLPATLFDPVVSITTNGRAVNIKVRGLGRNGKNPYVAVNPDKIADASMYDNHINSVGLERAAGSADLGYRLFAEMANMQGRGIDASSVLLTNNNIRRHVQSVYADTLFGPGMISPMEPGNRQSPQGVPQALWEASTPDERIGLNMLRLAHSVTENRYRTGTLAAFLENLQYRRDGSIIAATEPKHANGFERGTIVTDEMLLAKLRERSVTTSGDEDYIDPQTGRRMTNAMGRTNQGGVGVDTAKLAIMTNTVLSTIEGNPDKNVPGWLVTLAKQTGRDIGGWMFSRGNRTEGQDATTMRDRLRKLMVNPAKFDERVTVVQSESDVPGDFTRTSESTAASTRMAFYDPATDHIWMVADNVPKGREFAVFLHEAGVHMGMRKLLGGTYSSLVTQIREWQLGSGKLENQIAQMAAQRVQDAGGETMSKRVADEELVAYFVEEAVTLGINPTALATQPKTMQAWFTKLWDAVKAAITKFGVNPDTLTAEDVVNLAYGAARLQLNDSFTDQDAAAEATAQEFDAPTTEGIDVAELAQAPTKGETVQGVHYSDRKRTELDTSKYGTGMPGAEARRIANGGIKERTMFYVDEGTGITPESGVGSVPHNVTLENMYNTSVDPDGFVAAHRGDSNAWEQAILDAGYNGYYAPGRNGKQGNAVVLGKKIIPVPQSIVTETKDKKAFFDAIKAAKAGKFGAAVTLYSEADYANMRTFLSPNGKTGFALNGDDIVSVFNADENVKGAAGKMLPIAVREGGRRLDAFDTVLPDIYAANGFKVVARMKWNDEYAPDGWDKETFAKFNGGEPDVVFMAYVPGEASAEGGRYVTDWDDGVAAQDAALQGGTNQTDTEAFKNWFGDSKVVDASGRPLVVYHGTVVRDSNKAPNMGNITAFDRMFTTRFRQHSIDTVGSWFSNNPGKRGAEMYAGGGTAEGGVIYPVYLSIQNPHHTTFQLMLRRARLLANGVDDGRMVGEPEVTAYRKWLNEMGKDGIHITHDEGAANQSTEFEAQDAWIALEPNQIKSATGNNGNFDTADNNILNSIAPVQQPSPQELNIVKPKGRGWLAQLGEPIRKALQDSHVTLRRIQQLAGIDAENIKLDTMGALDRLGSKMMAKHKELVKVPLERMSLIMVEGGFTKEKAADELGTYLKMKHVAEYNAHIATINPAVYDAQGQYVRGFDAEHPGSGIFDLDAAAEIIRLESLPTRQVTALKNAEAVYRKMIEDLQDFAVARGIEKAETVATWREQFPNYVPFNRDLDLDQNTSIGSVAGTKEFSMRAGISRSAMGSGADIINPLISTLLLGGKIVRRGEHAVVSRTLYEFAQRFVPNYIHSSGELRPMWVVNKMPPSRIVKQVNVYQVKQADGSYSHEFYSREDANAYADMLQTAWAAANPNLPMSASGIVAEKMFENPQRRVIMQEMPNVLNDPNVIVFPIDGENHIMVFDKESEDAMSIKKALKGEDKLNPSSPVLVPFRMMSNWVASTSTQFNPVFSFFNFVKDVPAAAINMNAHNIPGWEKTDSVKMVNEARKNLMPLFKRAREEWLHEHHDGAPVAPTVRGTAAWWHEQAVKHGGVTGVRQSFADIDSAETEIRRMYGMDALAKLKIKPGEVQGRLDTAKGMITKIGDSFYRFGEGSTSHKLMAALSRQTAARFSQMNEAAESSTRTAAFKLATEKFMLAGKSEKEAMILAANVSKNISTNFNRRGSWSAVANQLFPFFNAAVQGSARLAETLFEKTTIKGDYNGHQMLDQSWKLTPLGKKILASSLSLGAAQAVILSMAGFEDDEPPAEIKDRAFIIPVGDGDYVAVPMPYGFNNIVNFGREMTDAVMNPSKFVEHVGEAIWKSAGFSPLGATGNLLTTMSPALTDPIITSVMNEDAFGRPIGKPDLNPSDKTPGFTRAKEGASDAGRWIAEALNTISGGNEDQPGYVSPTPDMIDNLLGVVGGGVGRETLKAGRAVANVIDSEVLGNEVEPTPLHKIPLVGRVVGSVSSPVAQRSRMFNIREELNSLNNRYEGLLERGQTDEADALLEAHPELEMRAEFESFARGNSKATKQRALARGNDEVGEVNRITAEQDAGVADLLARYKELKNAQE